MRTFGGQHALIHAQIPVVANVGYLVDSNVFHPGDSFVVPDGIQVKTLLVPIHAPWSKVSEVVDFVVSVRAPRAFPVHDGLLNELGRGAVEAHVARIGSRYGTTLRVDCSRRKRGGLDSATTPVSWNWSRTAS